MTDIEPIHVEHPEEVLDIVLPILNRANSDNGNRLGILVGIAVFVAILFIIALAYIVACWVYLG